jgi:hypothetical protein
MDKRNLAINNQIEQFIKIIEDFELSYTRKELNETMDQQQVFKIISEENKYLKNIVTKISKINELRGDSLIEYKSIDNLDSIIESLSSKITKVVEKEEVYEEPKITIKTVCDLEEIKRAFFSKEYDTAFGLLKEQNLKYYRALYKYASDNDNKPDFIAKNLVGGFVRNLEDFSKYFLVCFRCYKNENTFNYPSLWIVNIDPENTMQDVMGTLYDDFEFIDEKNIDEFLNDLQKKDEENLLLEKYLH